MAFLADQTHKHNADLDDVIEKSGQGEGWASDDPRLNK